ncbi:MAG: hypothetical protein ACK4MV_10995 [Beijerinckiaceae bacterium]
MSEASQSSAKLITIFGPPSGFTHFCVFILHHLLRATIGEFDHVAASEVNQLRPAWAARRHSNFLLFSDCPERAIIETYLRTSAPVILIVEDPVDVIEHIIHERALDPAWAIRLAEQSLSTLIDVLYTDHTLRIPRDSGMSLKEFLSNAARHFALPLEETHIHEIGKAIAPGVIDPASRTMDLLYRTNWPNAAPRSGGKIKRNLQMLSPILNRMREIQAGRPPVSFEWPVELFMQGGSPHVLFCGEVSLVGPARCIIYGPYLSLPNGEWEVEARLHVSENYSGNGLEIDVYQSEVLCSRRFPLPAAGGLELRARFRSSDPRSAVQLRFMTTQGAIEGVLSLLSVKITAVNGLSVQ